MSIMKEKEMKNHTKKQLRCTESEQKKPFDIWSKTKTALIWGVKALLRMLLMRPSTWTWVMVKLPELIEKSELFVRNAFAFVMDLLS